MSESGLPGFEVSVWHALYATKGTPRPVIDRLATALREALRDPLVKSRFAELGTEPVAEAKVSPDTLRSFLRSEVDRWGPIIRKAGVYAD